MDRASDSGSEGWGFESLPVYQKYREGFCLPYIFYRKGLERAAPVRRLVQKLRTVEQFLARGRVHVPLNASGTDVDSGAFCCGLHQPSGELDANESLPVYI